MRKCFLSINYTVHLSRQNALIFSSMCNTNKPPFSDLLFLAKVHFLRKRNGEGAGVELTSDYVTDKSGRALGCLP